MISRVAETIGCVGKRIATATKVDKSWFLLIVAYMILILYITVFSRTPGSERIFKGLFWEYRNVMRNNTFLNILLFLPLGFITGVRKGTLIGFLLLTAIEITQESLDTVNLMMC